MGKSLRRRRGEIAEAAEGPGQVAVAWTHVAAEEEPGLGTTATHDH